jgi:hypothetical protein
VTYEVEVERILNYHSSVLRVSFAIIDRDEDDIRRWNYSLVPSKGNLFKVMSTVSAIVKKELELIEFPVKTLKFSASPDKDKGGKVTQDKGKEQRRSLYSAYITKAMPGIKQEDPDSFDLTGTELYKQKLKSYRPE